MGRRIADPSTPGCIAISDRVSPGHAVSSSSTRASQPRVGFASMTEGLQFKIRHSMRAAGIPKETCAGALTLRLCKGPHCAQSRALL